MFLNKAVLSGILFTLISGSVSAATVPAAINTAAATPATASATGKTAATSTDTVDLKLTTNVYTLHTQTVNAKPVTYRAYENLVYVAHPVDAAYEKMNLYVPEVYYQGQSSNGFTAKTAPIFMPNQVGGYMPGQAAVPGTDFLNGGPNAALYALSRGYVVAAPALRGRTLQNADGTYTGKAPACIVDYKAAVRYLRYNRKRLPAGDTEKIISNGTSAGGALSALLGATGNSKDYEPYLKALGAANEKDQIFASMAYCPITNLEHADMAYEWIFNGVNTYHQAKMPAGLPPFMGNGQLPAGTPATNAASQENLHGPFGAMVVGGRIIPLGPGPVQLPGQQQTAVSPTNLPSAAAQSHPKTAPNRPADAPMESGAAQKLTPQQIMLSPMLKDQFPAYVNSLGLKNQQGRPLTLDKNGNGSFKNYLESYYLAAANSALQQGQDLSKLDWLTLKNGRAVSMDLAKYAVYATRLKSVPAFDALDLSSGENSLFGTTRENSRHFTSFSAQYGNPGSLADANIIKLLNPLNYIGKAATAKYWRIRHGAVDRDTSLAVPLILATKLANKGAQVDFASPWGKGHAGDYDLPELFAWADQICHAK